MKISDRAPNKLPPVASKPIITGPNPARYISFFLTIPSLFSDNKTN